MTKVKQLGLVKFLVVIALSGCATTTPYVGTGPNPKLSRGHVFLPIDALGNLLALPEKILLWNWRFNSHSVSENTEQVLVTYLNTKDLPLFQDAKFRLNEYAPQDDFKRLIKNHNVAWPYRLFIGFPVTLIAETLLPGRLFPWGDYYNPWTNTVHLYSDHPAVSLHEAGHVNDFSKKRFKGTYALVSVLPFVDLYLEWQASKETIVYLRDTNQRELELSAYKILYPAYGSYVGGYIFPPIGTAGGVILGHVAGRSEAALRAKHYKELDAQAH
jgi:hypothetical protein